jgi:hypothetical protein
MVQAGESPRQTRKVAIIWTVIVGVLTTFVAAYAFQGGPYAPPQEQAADKAGPALGSGPVVSIVLPNDPPDLPAGPSREAFINNCTTCHSARLVLNQPGFRRDKWLEIVRKMATSYGAPLDVEDEPGIADYLETIRGQ